MKNKEIFKLVNESCVYKSCLFCEEGDMYSKLKDCPCYSFKLEIVKTKFIKIK